MLIQHRADGVEAVPQPQRDALVAASKARSLGDRLKAFAGVRPRHLAQRRAAQRQADELRDLLGAEAERGGAFPVHPHLQLAAAVAGGHPHVAQRLVAHQDRGDVLGDLAEHLA